MKKLNYTADEINNQLDLVSTIKEAQDATDKAITATNGQITQMKTNAAALESLANGTDAAFKGFIKGSNLNLKTIDASLTATKASLNALSGIKEWTEEQIKINQQQYDIALNNHKAAVADHYATIAGVQTIETSLDLVNKALGSVEEVTDTAGQVVGYQAESIKAVADSINLVKADHALAVAQLDITNTNLDTVKNIVDDIAEISESSGEIAHYQAKGVQALSDAINAEGTGLAALKTAAEAAQDAAKVNKEAFETFYKTDEKGEVLPGTVFGTFKTMVDEHDAAMKDTETGLTALHTAIGAVKGITDSQATLIEGQSKLITDHKAILDGVQTIANNSKTFLDDHKTAIENCITTAEVGNRINSMHTTVIGEIDTAQKTVSAEVAKVGEQVTAIGKDVAGIGDKVAQQMQIAFGEIVDPDTGEKRPNQLVVDIKNLADSANDHASNAEIASNAAKAKAEEIKGITDKLTTETLPAITNQVANAKQQTEALKTQVTEDLETLTGNYKTLNTNIDKAQTDLSNMKKDLDGDNTPENPGILKTVEKAQGIINTAQTDINKAKEDIQGINADLKQKQTAIKAAEGRLTTAEGTLNGLDDRFAEVNSNISAAQGKVDGLVKQLSGSDDPNATEEEKLGIVGKINAANAAIAKANKDIETNKTKFDKSLEDYKLKLEGEDGESGLLGKVNEAVAKVDQASIKLEGPEGQPELGLIKIVENAQKDIIDATKDIKKNKEELSNSIDAFKVEVNGTGKEGDPEDKKLGLIGQANKAINEATKNLGDMRTEVNNAKGTLGDMQKTIDTVNNETIPKVNQLAKDAETLSTENKQTAKNLTDTAAAIRSEADLIKKVADKAAQDIKDGKVHLKGSISIGGTPNDPNFKVTEKGLVSIKTGEIDLGSGKFHVTDDGALTATSGQIAGFNINGNNLESSSIHLTQDSIILDNTRKESDGRSTEVHLGGTWNRGLCVLYSKGSYAQDLSTTYAIDGITRRTPYKERVQSPSNLFPQPALTISNTASDVYHDYQETQLEGSWMHLYCGQPGQGQARGVVIGNWDTELWIGGEGSIPGIASKIGSCGRGNVYCPTGIFKDQYGSLDSRRFITYSDDDGNTNNIGVYRARISAPAEDHWSSAIPVPGCTSSTQILAVQACKEYFTVSTSSNTNSSNGLKNYNGLLVHYISGNGEVYIGNDGKNGTDGGLKDDNAYISVLIFYKK